MLGQFWLAQAGVGARSGSRSALAKTRGALAATGGAKLGKIVNAAAANTAMATAESALIMVRVPVASALAAAHRDDARRGLKVHRILKK